MESANSEFEDKAAAILGLYFNPRTNAAAFGVDDRACIHALEPTQRIGERRQKLERSRAHYGVVRRRRVQKDA